MIKIRLFTLAQYAQEEQWLESMAKNGWMLTSSRFPFLYQFKKEEPKDMIYRFDYFSQPEKAEDCIHLYEEYGWTHIPSVNGFLLFCKPVSNGDENDLEPFSTAESREEMVQRIIHARLIPLTWVLGLMFLLTLFTLYRFLTGAVDLDSLAISAISFGLVAILILSCWIQIHRLQRES